jgi:hypothetical protein
MQAITLTQYCFVVCVAGAGAEMLTALRDSFSQDTPPLLDHWQAGRDV